jgi:hypothetical protein
MGTPMSPSVDHRVWAVIDYPIDQFPRTASA